MYDTAPNPLPCKVTLAEPLDGTLTRLKLLVLPAIADDAAVTLPDSSPAVSVDRLVPNQPDPDLQITDESARHSVASQLLPPCLPKPLCSSVPSPAPCTVRLMAPDVALLAMQISLRSFLAYDMVLVVVTNEIPEVTNTRPVAWMPALKLLTTELSDNHVVLSHAVSRTIETDDCANGENLPPWTVKLSEPVVPPRLRLMTSLATLSE